MGPYELKSGHLLWTDWDTETKTKKTVLVHREVMELSIGRKLLPKEVVHHRDGNPKNNSIENLEILQWSEHSRHHGLMRAVPLAEFECARCGKLTTRLARYIRGNQGAKGHSGPYCGKSCAGKATYVRHSNSVAEDPSTWKHGTDNTYGYRRCRCNLCREAHTERARRNRARRNIGPSSNWQENGL